MHSDISKRIDEVIEQEFDGFRFNAKKAAERLASAGNVTFAELNALYLSEVKRIVAETIMLRKGDARISPKTYVWAETYLNAPRRKTCLCLHSCLLDSLVDELNKQEG